MIFQDAWLLNTADGKISSSSSILASNAYVKDLINQETGWWNTNLIDRCFYPPDALHIKSMPLCSIPQPDLLIWPKEKLGNCSIKLGYKLLCEWHDAESAKPLVSDQ